MFGSQGACAEDERQCGVDEPLPRQSFGFCRQIADGADPAKCRIIPNGIDVSRYSVLGDSKPETPDGQYVALVGRISPIKDVKTYIRAARLVVDRLPDVTFYVLGTPDEDVEYYEECRALAELMDLGDRLRFMGNVDMSEYYPKIDVLVLTSVSEAQPFVLIEHRRGWMNARRRRFDLQRTGRLRTEESLSSRTWPMEISTMR